MSDQVNPKLPDTGSCISHTSSTRQPQITPVTQSPDRNEQQVRSRWTPKPEQILILESIFNSGMVNPPKDETIKIRRLLERFGPVGDANVFYWFQNRRSRSRRRQRQMQASYMEANNARNAQNTIQYDMRTNAVNPASSSNNMIIIPIASGGFNISGTNNNITASVTTGGAPTFSIPSSSSEALITGSTSTMGGNGFDENDVEGFFTVLGFEEVEENGSQANALPFTCTHDVTSSDLQYQQPVGVGGELGGFVTVFINGVPTEVPRGPLDMKAMCGQDFLLVHSSGHPVPINEYDFSTHSLQHGESYFLVAKSV